MRKLKEYVKRGITYVISGVPQKIVKITVDPIK